eukprot:m.52676 g.52676  ORF g.52676 m.52676 type:complete len:185 (+) comp21640_c1_seq1:216-770(+)
MSCALSLKRSFGYESPERCDIDSRSSKRCRSFKASPPSSVLMQHRSRAKVSPSSLFQPSPTGYVDVERFLPKDKRRKLAPSKLTNKLLTLNENNVTSVSPTPTSSACGSQMDMRPAGNNNDILFTLDQVKAIVQSALVEKEAQLSRHYDNILSKRLQEQFDTFTKFNEDHIHYKMSQSQHMYMS